METKTCGICKATKTLDLFSPHPKASQGVFPNCKECRAAISRQYYYDNRERLLAQQRGNPRKLLRERKRGLRRKYGMTIEQYEEMFDEQNGACAICGVIGVLLQVDHDHEFGHVRSLLCKSCNIAIGLLADNPGRVRIAAEYLEFWLKDHRSS